LFLRNFLLAISLSQALEAKATDTPIAARLSEQQLHPARAQAVVE
jgi:hypothetical protein